MSGAKVRTFGVMIWQLWVVIVFFFPFFVVFALLSLWRIWVMFSVLDARMLHPADLIIFSGLGMFGWLVVYCVGLVLQRPVGLRMDQHGISGFFAPTLAWDEIKSVHVRKDMILLELFDPDAFWARQSGWARVRKAIRLQGDMAPVFVKRMQAPAAEIAEVLQDMHARLGRG